MNAIKLEQAVSKIEANRLQAHLDSAYATIDKLRAEIDQLRAVNEQLSARCNRYVYRLKLQDR